MNKTVLLQHLWDTPVIGKNMMKHPTIAPQKNRNQICTICNNLLSVPPPVYICTSTALFCFVFCLILLFNLIKIDFVVIGIP